MGILTIDTRGSFPDRIKEFKAQGNGHAHAVAQAIEYLSNEVLPAAIEQDHKLHEEGAKPDNGFVRARGFATASMNSACEPVSGDPPPDVPLIGHNHLACAGCREIAEEMENLGYDLSNAREEKRLAEAYANEVEAKYRMLRRALSALVMQ